MNPGRELDCAVAEKVMGWKRLTYTQANPNNKNLSQRNDLTSYWHSSDLKEMARAEECNDYYNPEDAWSPSADISAAWQVVEKFGHVVLSGPEATSNKWCATFSTEGNGWGDTAPHAICLAALKAVGI